MGFFLSQKTIISSKTNGIVSHVSFLDEKTKTKTAVLTIPSDFPTTYKITVQAKVGTTTITKDINVAEFKPVKDFSIAGTDGATSVEKGDSLQLISTIDPAQPSVNNGITWKITTSGIKTGTKIDENGNLTIAADETKTSITVQATLTTATITSGVLRILQNLATSLL